MENKNWSLLLTVGFVGFEIGGWTDGWRLVWLAVPLAALLEHTAQKNWVTFSRTLNIVGPGKVDWGRTLFPPCGITCPAVTAAVRLTVTFTVRQPSFSDSPAVTPHWHLALYWLPDYLEAPGPQKHRVSNSEASRSADGCSPATASTATTATTACEKLPSCPSAGRPDAIQPFPHTLKFSHEV